MKNTILKLTLLTLSIILFSACSFLNLKDDLQKQDNLVDISGNISLKAENTSSILVALISYNSKYPVVTNYTVLKTEGKFSFITEPGKYKVMAFSDLNSNQKYEDNEPIARSKILDLNKRGNTLKLEIVSSANSDFLEELNLIKKQGETKVAKGRLSLGKITTLDNDNFSEENVQKGLWQPYEFIKTVDFGLFFLEEYDPNKKVVLFIHGINGSPRNFENLIASLDKSKFQAFILYYPSGVSISRVSKYTKDLVEELQVRLKLEKISVVTHSMGGLTSRKLLNLLSDDKSTLVDAFISISTPWEGHAGANSGLKYSPLIIPVWRDMATSSDFIANLFKTPLPSSTKHYLLFSYKGSSMTTDGNSDGVVSIKSQLKLDAQEGASLVRGFNEDHNSILQSKEVIKLVNKILKQQL